MSKATATCTCRRCGAEFKKEVYAANSREARSKAQWAEGYYDLCSDCYQIEEKEKAAAKEAELELPELTGTEKQIAWARKIRTPRIESICKYLEDQHTDVQAAVDTLNKGNALYTREEIDEAMEALDVLDRCYELLISQTESRFWIDNRDVWYMDLLNLMKKEVTKPEEQKAYEAEQLDLSKMVPENARTTSWAKVIINQKDGTVDIDSYKDDTLINVLKSIGCKWSGKEWYALNLNGVTTLEDLAAEIANALLNAGFPVILENEKAREMAIDGTYTPTPTRTIRYDTGKGKLKLRWTESNNNIYLDAKRIKGAKWDKPVVTVPVDQYLDVEGFAEKWGFVFSVGAKEVIEKTKAEMLASTVRVAGHKAAEVEEFDGQAVLERPAEVMQKHVLED